MRATTVTFSWPRPGSCRMETWKGPFDPLGPSTFSGTLESACQQVYVGHGQGKGLLGDGAPGLGASLLGQLMRSSCICASALSRLSLERMDLANSTALGTTERLSPWPRVSISPFLQITTTYHLKSTPHTPDLT